MQVGVVQYVHVRTHGFAQCGRQFVAAEDAVDALECRLHDFESLGFDRGLIQEAFVEVADLLGLGPGARA